MEQNSELTVGLSIHRSQAKSPASIPSTGGGNCFFPWTDADSKRTNELFAGAAIRMGAYGN